MKKLLLFAGIAAASLSTNAQLLKPTISTGKGKVKHVSDTPGNLQSSNANKDKTPAIPFFGGGVGPRENVGKTTYDLQTNGSMMRRVLQNGNNISCFWTMSLEENVTDQSSFNDRGTGYAHYNGTAWSSYPTARLEAIRTGFSSAFYSGSNEAYIAHDGINNVLHFGKKTGTTWGLNQLNVSNANKPIWPHAASAGNWIYLIASPSDSNTHTNGIRNGYFFSRSNDNGTTWIDDMIPMPKIDSVGHYRGGGNSYAISANKDVVSIVFGDMGSDLTLITSKDNGATWEAPKVILDWPLNNFDFAGTGSTDYDGNGVDTIDCNDGSHSVVVDDDGVTHVAFPIIRVYKDGASTGYGFFYTSSLGYYNTDVDSIAIVDNIFRLYRDCNGDNTFSIGENYTGSTATSPDAAYNTIGTITQPSISVTSGANKKVLITYTAIMDADTTEDGTNPFWFGSSQLSGQNYRDVFVIGTEDGGLNWTYPVNITRSAHFEEAFASTPEVLTGTTLPVLYQADIEPGTIMQNADVYDPTFQNVMILQSVSIDDIFTEGALATAPCGQSELPLGIKTIVSKNFDALKIWPNPASDLLHVDLPVNYSGSNSVCNIFDMTGRKVIEAKLNSRKEINISSLTPGMYQVQVTGSNKSYTAKFVKE